MSNLRLTRSLCSRLLASIALLLLLPGCAEDDVSDLDAFMADKRARPGGIIKPIPSFEAYEAFTYAATTLRGPFDRPIEVRQITQLNARASVQPNASRPREFLEQFSLESLRMVGRIERGDGVWSLINDPDGGIHRVQVGNYLGKDRGKIVEMGQTYVAVIEIVSDGSASGWVERPRTIELISQ